jgi:hypothetical protein
MTECYTLSACASCLPPCPSVLVPGASRQELLQGHERRCLALLPPIRAAGRWRRGTNPHPRRFAATSASRGHRRLPGVPHIPVVLHRYHDQEISACRASSTTRRSGSGCRPSATTCRWTPAATSCDLRSRQGQRDDLARMTRGAGDGFVSYERLGSEVLHLWVAT